MEKPQHENTQTNMSGAPSSARWSTSTANKLKVEDLKRVLKAQGLPTTGLKAQLVSRLVEAAAPSASVAATLTSPAAGTAKVGAPASMFPPGSTTISGNSTKSTSQQLPPPSTGSQAAKAVIADGSEDASQLANKSSFGAVMDAIALECSKIVQVSPPTAAPDGNWVLATDPAGNVYYFHRTTRETTWVLPANERLFAPSLPATQPLGSNAASTFATRIGVIRQRANSVPAVYSSFEDFVSEIDSLLHELPSACAVTATPDAVADVVQSCREIMASSRAQFAQAPDTERSETFVPPALASTVVLDDSDDDDVGSDSRSSARHVNCTCGSELPATAPDFDISCVACPSLCHAYCVLPEIVEHGLDSWLAGTEASSFRCPQCEDPSAIDPCSKCGRRFNSAFACFEHEESCQGMTLARPATPKKLAMRSYSAPEPEHLDEEVVHLDLTRSASCAAKIEPAHKTELANVLSRPSDAPAAESDEADAVAKAFIASLSSEGFRHAHEGWLPYEPPEGMHAPGVRLKHHQAVAINWMLSREELQGGDIRGGLLLDEAGLGKTLTTLTLCRASWAKGECRQPTLIICPPSLMWTWVNETKHFNDQFRAIWYYGDYRRELKQKLGESASKWRNAIRQCEFVFASYEGVTSEYNYTTKKAAAGSASLVVNHFSPSSIFHYAEEFGRIILDESHYIRNRDIGRSRSVRAITGIPRRWCVTATPVHNRLDDYFAQLAFIRAVSSYGEWSVTFVTPMQRNIARGTEKLMKLLAPLTLRREKHELVDLPPMEHHIEYISLSKAEDEFYVAVFEYSQAKARQSLNFVQKLKDMRDRNQLVGQAYRSSLAQQQTELFSLIFRLRLTCVAPSVAFQAIERELKRGKKDDTVDAELAIDTGPSGEMTEDEAQLLQSGAFFVPQSAPRAVQREVISAAELSRGIALLRAAAIRINEGAGENEDDDSTCSICFVEKATHAAVPCSHVCCETCWSDVLRRHQNCCPFCRAQVDRLEPVVARLSDLETLAASIEKRQEEARRLEQQRKGLHAAQIAQQFEQSTSVSETAIDAAGSVELAETTAGTSLESSKIRWLIDEVRGVTKDEKVLVVSQWTSVLDHIADMLALHAPELRFCQLDGRTPPMQRAGTIDSFQKTDENRICLVSLGACAEGVTLTAASRVYHMDLWWNVAKDYQMANRVHRIGQTRDVKIVHVITEDTIEAKVLAMRDKKRKISNLSVGTFEVDDEDADYINNVRLLFDLQEEAALIDTRRRKIYNLDSDDDADDDGADLADFIVD